MSLPFLRRCLPVVILLAASTMLTPARAQSTDPLQALPSAQQVVDDMRGAGARDSAARATAALQVLEGVVVSLAGPRAASKQFTAAEQAKIDEYGRAHGAIWAREYDRLAANCESDNCAHYLYAQCAQGYAFSAPFYRELMDRYLPPDWQARHLARMRGKLWQTAASLPEGTRVPAAVGTTRPCAGAAQAALAAVTDESSLERTAQQLFGPRANMSNPRFRAFLDQAKPALAIGLALLVLFVLGYVRQFGRRVRFDATDPLKIVTPSNQELHTFTGMVLGARKGIETTTTTYTQDNRVTGSSSRSVVHDQFFIRTPDGQETDVKLAGVDVAVRDGHLMSAAWFNRKGKKGGKYLFLRNHTLQQSRFFETNERHLLGVRRRYLWLTLLTMLGLTAFLALSVDWWLKGNGAALIATTLGPASLAIFVVMGIVQWLSTKLGLRDLRRQLDERVIPELDRRAATMAVPEPTMFSRAD